MILIPWHKVAKITKERIETIEKAVVFTSAEYGSNGDGECGRIWERKCHGNIIPFGRKAREIKGL